MSSLCEDCPPIGYSTDSTRCLPCPRRADNRTVEQAVHSYLVERRMRLAEADAIVKILKTDSALGGIIWNLPARDMSPTILHMLNQVVCRKVLAWMDKYRENHPARCLFTGAS